LQLLRHGADPNAKTQRGKTPLHFAVASGREDLCHILLQNGSNPNAATTIERETPLHRSLRVFFNGGIAACARTHMT
jgi:ankyrin repeat protein